MRFTADYNTQTWGQADDLGSEHIYQLSIAHNNRIRASHFLWWIMKTKENDVAALPEFRNKGMQSHFQPKTGSGSD